MTSFSLSLPLTTLATMLLFRMAASADTEVFTFNLGGQTIPDGDSSGLADFRSITSLFNSLDSVAVTLNISGSFSGDIYASLNHSSGFSVLLNRSGRDAGNSFGYGDSGYDLRFEDTASHDIHTYQTVSTPSSGSLLTGVWQPDGRMEDPDDVLTTSPRSAMLSSFNGLAGSGQWTLFVADLSGGDTHQLNNWSLILNGSSNSIPEPGVASVLLLSTIGVIMRRRR